MLKHRLFAVLAVLMLLVFAFGVSAQDATIADVVAGDENFSTLASLVDAAGLTETLADTSAEYTVFAPTNDAFAALPQFVVDYLLSDAGAETLTRILTYHVLPGAVGSADVLGMIDATGMATATTVEGGELSVSVDAASMTAQVNNANLDMGMLDIAASNGVIHVIDTVLIPEIELPTVIPADVTGDIITGGSSTVGPLTVALADRFAEEGYTGEISVAIIGSGAGIERFCVAGETDIANASRAIREEEIASCESIGRTPIEFRVGTDALAVVVNPANTFIPEEGLTVEQLALAFGSAQTWADVDPSFPAEPILRFAPGTDSGTYDYFVEEVFDNDEAPIQGASNTQFSEDDNVLVEGVANNEFAVGFFGFAYYADNQDVLRILNIEGVEPSVANVDANTYPLARPLFIYSDASIIAEKPQVGSYISYYLTNVNDVLISDVNAQSAVVTDDEGNVIEYNISVAYFAANPYALRGSKLAVLALTGGM